MKTALQRHERRLVRFFSDPRSYPHPVEAIDRRETHVSHVFLAGGFAYKLKKPVHFPFLDASSLGSRKRFCRLELSLNRRLAPSIYLGIVPVVETPAGLRLGGTPAPAQGLRGGPGGRVIEWVVKMRRLPEDRMLDRLVAKRRVSQREIAGVAGRLATFFRRAARSRTIARYGEPSQVAGLVLGNLRECQPFLGQLFSEADRAFLDAAYRQYLTLHEPVLRRRVRERRIVDGHGDLRCENICLPAPPGGRLQAGTRPVIFDCVEFQPAFRCGDMASDFSFLVMDLEFRGRSDLAETLVRRYRQRISDPTFGAVLAFYKCHRSLVRGKVRGFAWLQHPANGGVRELSRRHFVLAKRYAAQFAPPRLIVIGGLIGTGKSTLARRLTELLGAVWLRTDDIRRREFARFRRVNQEFASGLYAPQVSALVYRRLIQQAAAGLRQGRVVLCDGMFAKAEGRERLRAIAAAHGASFHLLECVVPRAVALRRVGARAAARTDLSEARPEHYDRLRAGYEPIGSGWRRGRDWTRLSDDRAPEQTCQAALAALRRAWVRV